MEHLRLFRYVTYMKDYDSLGPGSALGKKREKNRRAKKKKFDKGSEPRGTVGGERVAEPGDMPLMPQICPPASNLSLKCQHVKFSPQMSV